MFSVASLTIASDSAVEATHFIASAGSVNAYDWAAEATNCACNEGSFTLVIQSSAALGSLVTQLQAMDCNRLVCSFPGVICCASLTASAGSLTDICDPASCKKLCFHAVSGNWAA